MGLGSGKWLSTVNGTGGFNGSTSFQGAGAGTGATLGSAQSRRALLLAWQNKRRYSIQRKAFIAYSKTS